MYGIVYSICTNGGILCAVRCVVVDVGAAFCVVVDAAWCTANGKRHVLAKHRRCVCRPSVVRRRRVVLKVLAASQTTPWSTAVA
mgnify:CR=1 FL=1